jgi:hypothetical protein
MSNILVCRRTADSVLVGRRVSGGTADTGGVKVKAEIKGKNLVITIPLFEKPKPSSSGKSLLVCSSRGVKKLSVKFDGQPIRIVLNGFIDLPAPTSVTRNKNQETPEEDGDEEDGDEE